MHYPGGAGGGAVVIRGRHHGAASASGALDGEDGFGGAGGRVPPRGFVMAVVLHVLAGARLPLSPVRGVLPGGAPIYTIPANCQNPLKLIRMYYVGDWQMSATYLGCEARSGRRRRRR